MDMAQNRLGPAGSEESVRNRARPWFASAVRLPSIWLRSTFFDSGEFEPADIDELNRQAKRVLLRKYPTPDDVDGQ